MRKPTPAQYRKGKIQTQRAVVFGLYVLLAAHADGASFRAAASGDILVASLTFKKVLKWSQ